MGEIKIKNFRKKSLMESLSPEHFTLEQI